MKKLNPLIKFIIAILLLLCLADMPYGFFQLVRITASAAFAYLSYDYFKTKNDDFGFLFAALALLFQPFFKISLGRTIWNIVDVIVAVGLFFLIIKSVKKKNK